MLKYAKAIVGALIAGLGALSTALANGGVVSVDEWVAIAVTTLVALGAVFGVPNQTATDPNAVELAGLVTKAADDAKAVLDAINAASNGLIYNPNPQPSMRPSSPAPVEPAPDTAPSTGAVF